MLLHIFKAVEIMFFMMGVLTTLTGLAFYLVNKKYKMNWKSWSLLSTTASLLLFAVSWSWSSFIEGEPQSGSMGLLLFGLSGLIFGSLTWKLIQKINQTKIINEQV